MGVIIGDEGYGETSVSAIYLGDTAVTKIYLGTTVIYTTS
jgi:hypothetical protein